MRRDVGKYIIRCIKSGGVTLTNYGQKYFAEEEELDLLNELAPSTIKASDFSTASNMCEDSGFELAQRIASGEFIIVLRIRPTFKLER